MIQPDLTAKMSTGGSARPAAASRYTIARCHRCDYPLMGLPPGGRCPECNTPVADSLRGWELRFASRRYLRVLCRGLGLAVPGMILVCALWFTQNMLVVFNAYVGRVSTPMPLFRLLSGLFTVMVICMSVGLWRFATPESAAPAGCPQRKWSRLGRMQLCVLTVVVAVWMLAAFYGQIIYSFPPPVTAWLLELYPHLFSVLGIFIYCGIAGTTFTVTRYTRVLARRADDLILVRVCSVLQWVLPGMVAVGFTWQLLFEDNGLSAAVELIVCAAVLIAAITLRRMHRHLRTILADVVQA